jgi:flagellar basal-body rod protein FlgF
MLYVAMTAAKQALRAQSIATHNLANSTTHGFKADLEGVRAMPLFGPGYPSRVFAVTERPGINLGHGAMETTGAELDVAIDGEGWLAVQAFDGSEAYTRAGNLRLNGNGMLETSAGHPVLGNGGLIALPQAESVVIGVDGTISIRPLGQEANTLAQVERLKLVNPPASDLYKGEDGLFRMRDGGSVEADANVRVKQGALESSNVDPVAEMLSIISLARRYELAVRAMDTARESDQASAASMRLNA